LLPPNIEKHFEYSTKNVLEKHNVLGKNVDSAAINAEQQVNVELSPLTVAPYKRHSDPTSSVESQQCITLQQSRFQNHNPLDPANQ